jgi:L-malate glycosyltransferase
MVGDGPERSPAEHLARELKVERHISFLGKQSHVERLIPLAHVLLMPSELESFGLVALEGMACGVAPVATRVGGVPGIDHRCVDGYLEAVGDIAAQAARVVQLLTDDNLHYRMAKAGRWNASERFCCDKIIPQYEKYYEDVCRAPSMVNRLSRSRCLMRSSSSTSLRRYNRCPVPDFLGDSTVNSVSQKRNT